MLINDKSQLKRNVKQIGFQPALKTSKSLSWSDRLMQTVPYCRTGNREGSVSKLSSCPCQGNMGQVRIWRSLGKVKVTGEKNVKKSPFPQCFDTDGWVIW